MGNDEEKEGQDVSLDSEAEVEEVDEVEDESVGQTVDWEEKYRKTRIALKEERQKKKGSVIEETVETIVAKHQQLRLQEDIEETAERLGETPEERKRILDIYKSDLKPSGFSRRAIERDLKKAKLLASEDKFVAEAEKKAKKSLAEAKAMGATDGQVRTVETDSEDEDWSEFSDADRAFMKRRGITPSKVKKSSQG